MKPRHPAPLNALRAFEAAARHRSFRTAAAQLFVTPAAVSHQVKQLEAYLGVKLFHRGHRLVELTPKGEELAASLSELFGLLDLALDRATAATVANLRVSTVESFAAKWLAPRLHRFHRDVPDLKVRIDTSNEHADLVRGAIDVAIRYGPGGYSEVSSERLMGAPVFPVCAPSLMGDETRPLTKPADLRHHTLLHDESAAGRPGVPDWSTWLKASGATLVDATRGPVFASIYLAQEAAVAGHGIALGVAPLVEEDLRQGRLVRPFEHSLENGYAFWIVRRDDADANPAIDAFCHWLRKEAG
ncbi:LysR family transcriptional regulator [Steroidobacter agaridevorans]|uniref:LysR family transcriptional regulator n=1 Tax=Steroidobacter agaridevorans TaxID=2695856 RepID=A0A829Y9Q2_9GAMM|nr:transcriptional regulator GcvA [Steroidobacter agaridevorans]GFE79342.1 LysR family transcriptional regulator [Steroidobacter agaridevorans]GFE88347.1 LysR family transcriptional regulator [Steroidobacter agaridevorans]